MPAAGGAVWYFFTQADAPIEGQEEEKASLEALEFVDIENLSIPVIREGRVDRYITISVSLEMRDQDSKELGDEAFPRLKDAVFSQLYSYFSMQQSGQSGINIAQVKARLLWAAERAIGKGHVRQVIIQGRLRAKGASLSSARKTQLAADFGKSSRPPNCLLTTYCASRTVLACSRRFKAPTNAELTESVGVRKTIRIVSET